MLHSKLTKAFICITLLMTSLVTMHAQETEIDNNSICVNCSISGLDPSAIFQADAFDKGILVPRINGTSAIISPTAGLLIFDTSSNTFKYFDGSNWQEMGGLNLPIRFENIHNSFAGELTGISNTGANNTAFGYSALSFNVGGNANTAVGAFALQKNDSGIQNVAMGNATLSNNDAGNRNTAVGTGTLNLNTNGDGNTAVGYGTLALNNSGADNVALGIFSLLNNKTGNNNVAIGSHALNKSTDRSNNIAVGDSTLFHNGTNATMPHQGTNNVAFGSKALHYNEIGFNNSALGTETLLSNTSGDGNTAVGLGALKDNTTGNFNNAIGAGAMYQNTIGNNNVAIGNSSMSGNSSGNDNIAIGLSALQISTIGSSNIAIGRDALLSNGEGNGNVAIGFQAMKQSSEGTANTAIGLSAMGNIDSLTNTTAIGAVAIATASNQVVIGNSNVTEIGGYANWSNLSDARFKQNVKEDVPGLKFIKLLKPVSYQLDADGLADFLSHPKELRISSAQKKKALIRQSGFIAQDVEQAALLLSYNFSGIDKPKNKRDHYSLRYAEFVVPLVKAVQELDNENRVLKNKNADLEARLLRLEAILLSENDGTK